MGGLLDKANATKEAVIEDEPAPVVVAKSEAAKAPLDNPGLLAAGSGPGSPDTATKISLAGWVIILVGAILSLQGGAWGFAVVAVVVVLGVGAIVQAERMRGSINQVKLGASVVVALLIATTPYAAVMLVPTNASMAITDVALNEDTNQLTFKIRGTMSSVDVSIEADDVEVFAESASVSNDVKNFKVDISDIFQGNARNYEGQELIDYVIKATGSDGSNEEVLINHDLLVREAMNGGVRFAHVLETTGGGGSGGTSSQTEVKGISIEIAAGLYADSETNRDGGGHSISSDINYPFMSGDYTVDIKIKKGSSQKWSHSTISVDGDTASWSSPSGGSSGGSMRGWLALSGDAQSSTGVAYLSKDSFYDDKGCYEFEVTITNEVYADGPTQVFSDSWNIDWDGENDEDATYDTC
jgi:hypothetical protein